MNGKPRAIPKTYRKQRSAARMYRTGDRAGRFCYLLFTASRGQPFRMLPDAARRRQAAEKNLVLQAMLPVDERLDEWMLLGE